MSTIIPQDSPQLSLDFPPDEKRCGTCKELRPLSWFGKCPRSPGGLKSRCRKCRTEMERKGQPRKIRPLPAVGDVVGLWTVIAPPTHPQRDNHSHRMILCRCKCGSEKSLHLATLLSSVVPMCRACAYKSVKSAERLTSENLSRVKKEKPPRKSRAQEKTEFIGPLPLPKTKTRLYKTWQAMRNRCSNPNRPEYKDYGGRGISVCPKWQADFEDFKAWAVLNGYGIGLSLDRIDVDGNYEPGNCRWATVSQQSNNRRKTVFLAAWGVSKPCTEWATDPRCLVSATTLRARIKSGWSAEDALSTAVNQTRGSKSVRAPRVLISPALSRAGDSNGNYKHGGAGTRLYVVWGGMRGRCNNPSNSSYPNYGGRGIKVGDEWKEYNNFRTWALSSGYGDGMSLDRIDVNGNYEPSNCRWTDSKTQNRNRRSNRSLTINGVSKLMVEWAESDECAVSAGLFYNRVSLGWDGFKALVTPAHLMSAGL